MAFLLRLLTCFLLSSYTFGAPLPAKDLFQMTVKIVDANNFVLNWTIKEGYFLYQDRFQFVPTPDSNYTLGTFRLPNAVKKTTPAGITYAVYRNQLTLPIAVLGTIPGEGVLKVHYQGCSDDGFCYPPQTKCVKLTIDQHLALQAATLDSSLDESMHEDPANDAFSALFANHHWPIILIIFFGFGLLLAFTPCILPMVPVLSGIIVGHGKNLSTRKGFLLSLTYVLSMSLTYAIVGAMVALMGSNLQIIMQSPWTIGVFSFIFVVLALSMFGLYELRLPTNWQAKFANVTRLQQHGHYLSAAIMGCFSTLILSPCITPPLIGVLAYIAQKGNIILGSVALFCLSLGMGTPLILVGLSAGKLLPKAGVWMNTIKGIFGIFLLGTAIYLLQRILSPLFTMWLWSILCVFSGVYLGAFQKAMDRHHQFRQALGLILVSYGLLILVGLSQGHHNPLQPLVSNPIEAQEKTITMTTLDDVEHALQMHEQPIILDFYADWCTSCKHIESTTLQDVAVQRALNDVLLIKVDLTKNNKDSRNLLSHFSVVAPPTFLFFNQQGNELRSMRLVGDFKKEQFLQSLNALHQYN